MERDLYLTTQLMEICLGVMYLMFLFTINISSAFIDIFDIAAGTIFVDGFAVLRENSGYMARGLPE